MISYRPLFCYLADNEISSVKCRQDCNISPNTWTKIKKGKEVSMAVLTRICETYNLTYGAIVEYTPLDK